MLKKLQEEMVVWAEQFGQNENKNPEFNNCGEWLNKFSDLFEKKLELSRPKWLIQTRKHVALLACTVLQELGFPMQDLAPFLGKVEEVGELAGTLVKMMQGRFAKDKTPEERKKLYKEFLKDGLADDLIFTSDFANRNGIDLTEELERVWNKVKARSQKNWEADKVAEDDPTNKNRAAEKKLSPVDGGCWFCQKDGCDAFSVEFDCNLHLNCLQKAYDNSSEENYDQEAEIMATEFGLDNKNRAVDDSDGPIEVMLTMEGGFSFRRLTYGSRETNDLKTKRYDCKTSIYRVLEDFAKFINVPVENLLLRSKVDEVEPVEQTGQGWAEPPEDKSEYVRPDSTDMISGGFSPSQPTDDDFEVTDAIEDSYIREHEDSIAHKLSKLCEEAISIGPLLAGKDAQVIVDKLNEIRKLNPSVLGEPHVPVHKPVRKEYQEKFQK